MKPEYNEILERIDKRIDEATNQGIEKHVNGYMRDFKIHLGKQDVKLEKMYKKIEELAPISEGLTFVKTLRRFALWAAPAGAILWGWIKFSNKT